MPRGRNGQSPSFQVQAGLCSELSREEVELVTWPVTWNKGHKDMLTKAAKAPHFLSLHLSQERVRRLVC